MNTSELNVRMGVLAVILLLISTVILTGLLSPNHDAPKNFNAYQQLAASVTHLDEPQKESETSSITGQLKEKQAMHLMVVNTHVKGFIPEFDEAWCRAHCPAYKGQTISLQSKDLVVTDEKGNNITNYDELVMKSSPTVNDQKQSVSRHLFSNGFIHVKGIGPMKINAISFDYE
jgi:hypothetical protein